MLTRSGDWIDVVCPPGGIVCNIGDALARWTNDRWASTLHRVGNPQDAGVDRISLVYFHSPNHDALIECVPSCAGPDGAKYPPVTFADHYLGKVMKAAHARLNADVGGRCRCLDKRPHDGIRLPGQRDRKILKESRSIALVGASPRPERASHRVMKFLQSRGHKVYPVNPVAAGETINDETVLTSLDDLPASVDMVDIFRRSSEAGPVVDDAIRIGARTVWLQLDVIDEAAATRAEEPD